MITILDEGWQKALLFLHRMPGPHLVQLRKNWSMVRVWGWLADATVYLLLFMTATGVYLWWLLRAERKAGLIALGAGVLTFWLLVMGLL